jgi:RNA polymerase sigma-70 factor (ECF subfamily)
MGPLPQRCPGSAPAVDPAPTDEQLVARAVEGDRRAFEQLIRRHQRPVMLYLSRQTGQRESARDLAQDVFLKVYLSLARFDPAFRFKTWLYRITTNCAIDHLRRRAPATCAIGPEPDECGGAEPHGTGPGPDEWLRLHELEQRLDAAVRRLPPDFRQLILLRYRHHCRYDEIARIADLPLGTVKNRIFRAREILRGDLADLLGAES